jgi:hypothetical protein
MKIALIEPSKTGVEHISFNSGVVRGLISEHAGDLRMYCSKSQFEALNADIAWTHLPVVSITQRSFLKKFLVELLALLYALIHARLHGFRRAMLLSVFTPLLVLVPAMARMTGMSVTVLLHGELDGLLDKKRQKITSYGYWIKQFFDKKLYLQIKCAVLSKGIQRRLADLYPDCERHTVALHHPVDVVPVQPQPRDIAFATFGIATAERLAALYAAIEAVPAPRRPRLHHIGMSEPELFERFKGVVEFSCRPGESLSPQAYEAMAVRVCHALVLYQPSDYQLRVSSAMIDALRTGAKLITYPCGYAKDLQQDGFDVILVSNLDELMRVLLQAPQFVRGANIDTQTMQAYSSQNFARLLTEAIA